MLRHLSIFLFLIFSFSAQAQIGGFGKKKSPKSRFSAVSEVSAIAPGESFQVAITLKHPKHFHSYYINPGTTGYSLSVDWTLPDGFKASELHFPVPHQTQTKLGDQSVVTYGYENTVTFLYTITAPATLAVGSDLTISGDAGWQICDDKGCLPEDKSFSLSLKSAAKTQTNASHTATFDAARASLPSDGTDWEFKVSEDGNVLTLTATAPAGVEVSETAYFFAADQQIDSQVDQEVSLSGQTLTLKLKRNLGNEDLFIQPGKVRDTLSGILSFKTDQGESGVTLSIPLNTDATVASPPSHSKAAFIAATEEEKAAGLALWDPEARPDYVLLGGAKEQQLTFFKGLGLVFIGGLLLNLMPCVFPVLGLKIMGFVAQAGEDPRKIKNHGLIFGLGLLVAMWILAAIIISLGLSWGEQLGNPIFLGSIIILLFVLGLNLFGFFEFGTSMTSVGGNLQQKKGYSGSFFSGVLTTLIATPCSGPFLGLVMGYALSQDNKLVQLAIFTVFALGIASPYIILSFFPKLIQKLPRPGAWMESFKQLMSFAMFATVAFFLKSYLNIVGNDSFILFLFALLAIALATYIYGRWGTPFKSAKQRYVVGYAVAGLFGILGFGLAFKTAKLSTDLNHTASKVGDLSWHEWYPGKMEISRSKNRIVWLDFTADW